MIRLENILCENKYIFYNLFYYLTSQNYYNMHASSLPLMQLVAIYYGIGEAVIYRYILAPTAVLCRYKIAPGVATDPYPHRNVPIWVSICQSINILWITYAVNKGGSFIPEGAVLYRYIIAPGSFVPV